MKTSRRNFIKKTGALVGSAAMLGQFLMGLAGCSYAPEKFGFQVWTVKDQLVADFPGTLEKMAGFGYKQVEMCSPLGYSNAGFEPLNQMSGAEMKKIIDGAGLSCVSSHYGMGELRDSLDNRIEWAQQLGTKQMVAATFWLPEKPSLDDYRKAADELNEIGAKTKAAGIQMVFHNHHFEFEKRGDTLIYDVLLEAFDPEMVKMQFQVAVVDLGYQAADYFRKYPGRFISAHLADYSPEMQKQVPIGQGIVDWPDFFEAAKTGGVQNFMVEMEPDTFQPSAKYLLGL